jgi:hypothetical protein
MGQWRDVGDLLREGLEDRRGKLSVREHIIEYTKVSASSRSLFARSMGLDASEEEEEADEVTTPLTERTFVASMEERLELPSLEEMLSLGGTPRPLTLVTDEFGFIISQNPTPTDSGPSRKEKKANEQRWDSALAHWDSLSSDKQAKVSDFEATKPHSLSSQLRERVWRGIPNRIRGELWKSLARISDSELIEPALYQVRGFGSLQKSIIDFRRNSVQRSPLSRIKSTWT